MRVRSIVSIPAGSPVEAALESGADAVALTLADAGHRVEDLREGALYALPLIREAGKLAFLTVNHPRTQLTRDDLNRVLTADLSAVFLPHTTEPQDVRDLAVLLREFEYNRGIEPGAVRVFPVIDTARGLLRAAEIAAAVPRIAGLVFAGQAYADDIGGRHEEAGERLAYARGAVVAATRAHGGLPLVESSGLQLRSLAEHGFAGAIIDEPRLADVTNAAFGRAPGARERARAQVAAYEAARGEGAWVARYGTGVVDGHTVRAARSLLEE